MGYGAVKYADLKNQRLTNYKFNFDQMLNLTGNTAVYLLYAHARIAGIIRKSAKDTAGGPPPNCTAPWSVWDCHSDFMRLRRHGTPAGVAPCTWWRAAQPVLSIVLQGQCPCRAGEGGHHQADACVGAPAGAAHRALPGGAGDRHRRAGAPPPDRVPVRAVRGLQLLLQGLQGGPQSQAGLQPRWRRVCIVCCSVPKCVGRCPNEMLQCLLVMRPRIIPR